MKKEKERTLRFNLIATLFALTNLITAFWLWGYALRKPGAKIIPALARLSPTSWSLVALAIAVALALSSVAIYVYGRPAWHQLFGPLVFAYKHGVTTEEHTARDWKTFMREVQTGSRYVLIARGGWVWRWLQPHVADFSDSLTPSRRDLRAALRKNIRIEQIHGTNLYRVWRPSQAASMYPVMNVYESLSAVFEALPYGDPSTLSAKYAVLQGAFKRVSEAFVNVNQHGYNSTAEHIVDTARKWYDTLVQIAQYVGLFKFAGELGRLGELDLDTDAIVERVRDNAEAASMLTQIESEWRDRLAHYNYQANGAYGTPKHAHALLAIAGQILVAYKYFREQVELELAYMMTDRHHWEPGMIRAELQRHISNVRDSIKVKGGGSDWWLTARKPRFAKAAVPAQPRPQRGASRRARVRT